MKCALVFAYGQNPDGSLVPQTKDRCRKGAELYHAGKVNRIYLTTSFVKCQASMAMEMFHFLADKDVKITDMTVEPRGGNTAGEMDVFLELVPKNAEIVYVSTWYHIPRIIWLSLWRPRPFRSSYMIAWRHAHFKGDFLVEFLKMANAIIRPIRSSKKTARINQAPAQ